MRARVFVAAVAMALLAVGCKKSVKGEESRWKSANKQVDELAVLYPSFKRALEAQRREAKAIYDAAQQIEDKKAKIAKLSDANSKLSGSFIAGLAKVDKQTKELRSRVVELSGASKQGDQNKFRTAKAEVDRILKETKTRLNRGARTPAEATIVVNKVVEDIQSAHQLLARAAPQSDPAKAKPSTATPAKTTTPAAAPQPVKWECQYCNHKNEPGNNTCKNCGAARSKK